MRIPTFLPAVLLTTAFAAAQCPFTGVAVSSYGQGCNPAFGDFQLPTVSASLDATACTLDVDVSVFGGCCNTFAVGGLLVLGFQPVSVPLPFGGACTLLATPGVVLFLPSQGPQSVAIPLPASLPSITLYAQPGALYFTTIGLSYDFAFGAGAQLDLQ